MTEEADCERLTDAGQLRELLAGAKAVLADADALGLGPREHDPDRLRLLEAVAEAARAEAQFRYGVGGETFAEWIAQYGYLMGETKLVLLEALAALEAYDHE